MGFFDYFRNKLARGPAIIGTINTLAKQFLSLQLTNPHSTRSELYKQIIEIRYKILPIHQNRRQFLESNITDSLQFHEFVIWILDTETDLLDTKPDFIYKVRKVVKSELEKYEGLPK